MERPIPSFSKLYTSENPRILQPGRALYGGDVRVTGRAGAAVAIVDGCCSYDIVVARRLMLIYQYRPVLKRRSMQDVEPSVILATTYWFLGWTLTRHKS